MPPDWSHPQTISFGRCNITVPGPAQIHWGKAIVADVELSWQDLAADSSFAGFLAARKKTIPQETPAAAGAIKVSELPKRRVQLVYRNDASDASAYTIETLQDFDDHVLTTMVYGTTNLLPSIKQDVASMMDSFERTDGPVTEGFAIAGGVLHRAFDTNETVDLTVFPSLPTTPSTPTEIGLRVKVLNVDGKPDVLKRYDQGMGEVRKGPGESMKYLRKGPRTVAGQPGDEVFFTANGPANANGITMIEKAEFEAGGKARNPMQPYLLINFDYRPSGAGNATSKLADWDSMLQSARFHR